MYVIVAGCGRVGSRLAERLSYEGHDVVVIDRDPASFRRLGGTFNGITLEGVAFDEELLQEAGIERADAFVSVTNYDNTNLMAAEIASRVYRVPRVLARMYNPDKRETFRRLGVDFVCGTTMVAERIRDRLLRGRIRYLLEDPARDVWLVELTLGEVNGVSAGEALGDEEGRILVVYRGGRLLDPEGKDLEPGETLVAVVRRKGLGAVERLAAVMPGLSRDGKAKGTPAYTRPGKRGLSVVISGCGRVGAQLAEMLSLDGHQVTVIDKDRNSFRRLSKAFLGEVVEGEACDDEVLARAGLKKADAFAAVTNYDNTNLMAAEVVKHLFGVSRLVARMYNPDKEDTFRALGVDYVCGTEVVADAILEKISSSWLVERGDCCGNLLKVVTFEVPGRWEGRRVGWLEEEHGIKVAYLEHGEKAELPWKDLVVKGGAKLTALVPEKNARRLERSLGREANRAFLGAGRRWIKTLARRTSGGS